MMKIEEFKNITIAYMRNKGEYGPKNEVLMEEFKVYLKRHDLLNDDITILGIAIDNPMITPKDELRYDVGLIVEDSDIGLDTRKIDDGKYAIFEVDHTSEGVLSFWQNIPQLVAELLIDEGKPIIERYTMEKVKNHLCEFCIPLQ